MTALKPGYRVIWTGLDGVSEIRGVVERVFKQKALILTTEFQKVSVPLDELAIAPLKPKPTVYPPATEPLHSPATEPHCGEHEYFPTKTGWICRNCFHRTVDSSPEWRAAYIQHLEKLKAGYERDRDRHSGKRWDEINIAVEELAEEIAALKGSVAEPLPSIDATEPEAEPEAPVPVSTSDAATEPSPDSSGWVEEYSPHGKNTVYFRYVYRGEQGHRRTLHISGGNIKAPLAKDRADRVHNAIVCGMTPPEIVKIINSWRNKRQ